MSVIGIICNTAGFTGDFFILLAYYLLQAGKIKADQFSYLMYNFLGAILIMSSLYYRPNAPVLMIEIAWISISLYGFFVYYKNKKLARARS